MSRDEIKIARSPDPRESFFSDLVQICSVAEKNERADKQMDRTADLYDNFIYSDGKANQIDELSFELLQNINTNSAP